MSIEDSIEFRREVLETEYPEVKKLSKVIITALASGQDLEMKRLPGAHMDLNQDWPSIISTAKEIVSVISDVIGIAVAWKELSGPSDDEIEDNILAKLKADERSNARAAALGEKRTRSIVKKVMRKR